MSSRVLPPHFALSSHFAPSSLRPPHFALSSLLPLHFALSSHFALLSSPQTSLPPYSSLFTSLSPHTSLSSPLLTHLSPLLTLPSLLTWLVTRMRVFPDARFPGQEPPVGDAPVEDVVTHVAVHTAANGESRRTMSPLLYSRFSIVSVLRCQISGFRSQCVGVTVHFSVCTHVSRATH